MQSQSLVGTLIAGRYQLLERLGRGLTGDVYLAKHPVLGVRFAVKVLGEEYSDDEHATKRLKREAELVSRLNHPNIVTTMDFGEMPDHRFYLVMEYVHGQSLRKALRKLDPQLMPLKRTLLVLKQLCHGLTSAHDTGVIHRAVKPGNVLLTKSPGGEMQVKLVDFGMAKVIAEDGQSHVTRNRQVWGVPAYMAPEQLTGSPVDRRSDIYSVGVIAFEMLTGDLPFAGTNPIQIVAAHQSGAAPKLSLVRPADETKVPKEIEKIFMRCLSSDREQRPAHVSQLTEAILMALPRVPDEEDLRPVTITMVAGSKDEVAAWSSGENPDDTAEVDLAEVEKIFAAQLDHKREVAELSAEQKQHRLWNVVNRKAYELGRLLEKHLAAPDQLSGYLTAIDALAEQEVASETEIVIYRDELNETDAQWRTNTTALRDALLNLRVAHSHLEDDPQANAVILTTLDQQIDELEARLGAMTTETEEQQRHLEAHIQELQTELETIQRTLGENQLILLQLLRHCKQDRVTPDVEDAYAALEQMLRHMNVK